MKNTNNTYPIFILGIIICLFSSCSNIETDKIKHSFKYAINVEQSINEFGNVKYETFNNLNLGFFRGNLWIKLEIKNEESENKSYMFVSNDRFNRNYVFYKFDTIDNSLKLVHQIKDTLKTDYRTFNNPNPNLKIDLAPNEKATFLITSASDGRTKDATPKIMALESYFNFVNETTYWNIVFYGIIFCLLLINLYQWNIYKQKIYFYYIFYIISTVLVYLGIEGYLYNLKINQIIIDHFIFVSVKLWALSLIIYTSKFLEIQIINPKYYKFIKIVLFVVLGGTLLYQFSFYNSSIQYLHYFENVLSSLWLLLIIGMILFSVKTRQLELKYYLIPLACFILFTIIGLIDVHLQITSINSFTFVKIGAIIELSGFTYFMTVLIKKKLKKTERLENELLENRKKLQTASEELEEKDKILSTKTNIEKTDLISIFKLLENSLSTENEWNEFKVKFNELKPEFHKKLLAHQPNLTKSEIRLLTLIKIGYSQKEIANILSIAPDSVKKARSRVRKKMNLPKNVSLREMFSQL
ncbi:7TM diverse intracellular signaling domain-containing protein [Algibacter pacificus]|uniref:7TM diverse intracellular signaling domain-containing protein n=1 Tax=Algibacter pacificus TaxID=2599389 RepID=UPI0011CCBE33|nr:7TM diverse intracellular signaling domain-containing protein [Algibacter pacificus]